EITQAIRKKVALVHDIPVSAVVLIKVSSIPKTSSGKIQRHACRDGYLAGTLAAVATWTAASGDVKVASSLQRRGATEESTWIEEGDKRDTSSALNGVAAPEKPSPSKIPGKVPVG